MVQDGELKLYRSDIELAGQVAEYYRRNREFLKEFEPERGALFFTEDYQRTVLEREMEEERQRRSYRFYIMGPGPSQQLIGMVGLNQVVWGTFCSAYLSYKVDGALVNRGLMTRVVAMVVDYAFEELFLHRIEGNVMPRNIASRRVLEKNGFCNEGISRSYLKINGVWEDHVHMVKLNTKMHG